MLNLPAGWKGFLGLENKCGYGLIYRVLPPPHLAYGTPVYTCKGARAR